MLLGGCCQRVAVAHATLSRGSLKFEVAPVPPLVRSGWERDGRSGKIEGGTDVN